MEINHDTCSFIINNERSKEEASIVGFNPGTPRGGHMLMYPKLELIGMINLNLQSET
jgi:hypothetical protein